MKVIFWQILNAARLRPASEEKDYSFIWVHAALRVENMNPLLSLSLFISSDYPSAWYCSLFLCGRAAVHPFLLAPFGKLIHFLLKCLNNYSDIEVNCLIFIAMEASHWNPHTICYRNSSQKILCYQRGRCDLNNVFFFLLLTSSR